jgi:medium-chain acyl-[acyl-carrier-protein] hydrolase
LLCLAHAGSGPQAFTAWARHLPDGVELWPLLLPGRGRRGREVPLTRMADVVADLDRQLPADGTPPALFGHSMGALIAFELARLLTGRTGAGPAHLFVSACRAPHLALSTSPMHGWPTSRLLAELQRLGGTPAELLASTKHREPLLRPYRADLEVYETYRPTRGRALHCPISVFGGLDDTAISRSGLQAWRRHTTAAFSIDLFPGGHFYLHRTDTLFLATLCRKLVGAQVAIPPASRLPRAWRQ